MLCGPTRSDQWRCMSVRWEHMCLVHVWSGHFEQILRTGGNSRVGGMQAVHRWRVVFFFLKERPLVAGSGGMWSIQRRALAGPPPSCSCPGRAFFALPEEEQTMCWQWLTAQARNDGYKCHHLSSTACIGSCSIFYCGGIFSSTGQKSTKYLWHCRFMWKPS